MPNYKITGPDGSTYNVSAPDGASEADVLAYAQRNFKMAAAPSKPFGQQLSEVISDAPRQLGLTARYAAEGIGDAANFFTSPIRGGLNMLLPKSSQIKPIDAGGLADAVGLPKPQNGTERIVGDASRALASAILPIGVGGAVARSSTGMTKAIASNLAANPAQQMASVAAAGGAGGYTRETGGSDSAQLVASLGAALATPLALQKAQQLGQRAASVANTARRVLSGDAAAAQNAATQAAIERALNGALDGSGLTMADLPGDVRRSLQSDVEQALSVGGDLSPDALRRLADYRMTGATPTVATLSLDPVAITQQKNLAKLGANSKDVAAQRLAKVENDNTRQLIDGLNNLGANNANTLRDGDTLINAITQRNNQATGEISRRYAAARGTNGGDALLDHEAFVSNANRLLDESMLGARVPNDVRKILNREWTNVMQPQGADAIAAAADLPRNTFDVRTVEQMKSAIADLQRISNNGAEIRALGLVRQALDDAPLLPGQEIGQDAINAFNQGRVAHKEWMKIVDETPALKAVRAGVEPDSFIQQFIIGSSNKANYGGVAALKHQIADNPEAMGAIRNQITSYLKSAGTNGHADELNVFSQSSYNKALDAIGDNKLRLFFPAEDVARLRAIGRVASYEQVQPRGSAVNNSNTSGASVSALLDKIGNSSLLSKIPLGNLLADPLQNISIGMRSKAALNIPQSIARPLPLNQGAQATPIVPLYMQPRD